MTEILSTSNQGMIVEQALALATMAGGRTVRAHVYFEVDGESFSEVADSLRAAGFEVVRKEQRRYDYKERAWVVDAEFANGGVGVYLRRWS